MTGNFSICLTNHEKKRRQTMLVFLSDVHMTDGSSGETIKPTAFRIVAENICKMADTVKPLEEIRMVLLGDIFDIIRSAQWLAGAVRPWDAAGPLQGQIVRRILDDIITNNQKSLGYFDNLREYAAKMGVPFDITYVIGNHDWLVNRYPDCRAAAAKALGIAAGGVPFPSQLFEPGYKVFARHGDYYDEFNYTGDRDASSIGDAIVIELLNRYPQEAARRLLIRQ
jgi:UDP-2,3-diacylglucosamine pyrophosphatase LpxH